MGASSVRVVLLRVFVLCVFAATIAYVYVQTVRQEEPELTVIFFDVGQGDAIFIESPTGVQVLIDGGSSAGVLRELSAAMGFFDRSIDIMLATHADRDHIGGLVDVLARYEVGEVVVTENAGETGTAEAFRAGVLAEGARVTHARRGTRFDLGGGAMLEILFPDRDMETVGTNMSSIIAHLTYGEHEFLLTGDAPVAIEEYLVLLGTDLQSDVLKAGHHGSDTSTSPRFLDAVLPQYAVVSAGRDNSYGHPHASVMAAFMERGIQTKNTADEGSITFVSDGIELSVR